jgi:hypothetical protein
MILILLLTSMFVIFSIEIVEAASTVHFICETINSGNGGSSGPITLLTNLEYPTSLWVKGNEAYLIEAAGYCTSYGGKVCLDRYDIVTGRKSVVVNNPMCFEAVVVASDGKIYMTSWPWGYGSPGEYGLVSVVDPLTGVENLLLNIEISSHDMFIDSNDNILIIGMSDQPNAKSIYLLPSGSYTNPVVLKTGLGRCWSILEIGKNTYFSVGMMGSHAIKFFSNFGGDIGTFLTGSKVFNSLSFGLGYLYYANFLDGIVGRINMQTKTDETLLSGLNHPNCVRFDQSSGRLYFLEGGTNAAQYKDGTLKYIQVPRMPADKTAVIADPGYSVTPNDALISNIVGYLNYAGYSVSDIKKGATVTIEWLKTSLSHGVVFWRGHGTENAANPDTWAFWTNEQVTPDTETMYHDDLLNGRVEKSSDNFWGFTSKFIQYYYGQNGFGYSLIYAESCYGLQFDQDGSMASSFITCGAGTYVGYRSWVSPQWSGDADAQQFFYDTCHKGYTVSQAAKVNQWYDPLNSRDWHGDRDLELVSGTIDTKNMGAVVHSPAEIYLTDPLGRHAGIDPSTRQVVLEIPDATYVGGSELNGTVPHMVWVPEALNGTYNISLIGTGDGSYNLTVGVSSLFKTDTVSAHGNISTNQSVTVEADVIGENITLRVHEIATMCVISSKTIVGQNYTVFVNVTLENKGNYTENFDVTLYANTTAIATQTITLTSGNSTTITFTWNTTGFAKGNYTISAYVWPVSGETDILDNTFIDGWVFVGLIGDVNADGIVDIADIYLIALAYGTTPGQPGYKPNLDINGDGIIDIADIYITALHYGETDP